MLGFNFCFAILAAADDANIDIYSSITDSTSTITLSKAGEFYEKESAEDEVMFVSSSEAIIVAQYAKTGE